MDMDIVIATAGGIPESGWTSGTWCCSSEAEEEEEKVGKYESLAPVLRVACLWCRGDRDADVGIGGHVLGGGNRKEGGSGEQDEARDMGLLSNDALVRDGVGGSRDWSVSECKSREGEGEREDEREGGLDGNGEEGGVSRSGRNANLGFWRSGVGFAGRRWARWGGCHCGAGACLVLGGGEKWDQLGQGEGTGEGVEEEFCDEESLLLFSAKRGRRPIGTAER